MGSRTDPGVEAENEIDMQSAISAPYQGHLGQVGSHGGSSHEIQQQRHPPPPSGTYCAPSSCSMLHLASSLTVTELALCHRPPPPDSPFPACSQNSSMPSGSGISPQQVTHPAVDTADNCFQSCVIVVDVVAVVAFAREAAFRELVPASSAAPSTNTTMTGPRSLLVAC